MYILEVNNVTVKPYIRSLSKIIYHHFIHLENQPNVSHQLREIVQLLLKDTFYGILIFQDHKLIGYLICEVKRLVDARIVNHIWYIFVYPPFRNKKIGSIMMNKMIQKCKDVGINFITLVCDMTDQKVLKFYSQYGFVKDPQLSSCGTGYKSLDLESPQLNKGNKYDALCLYLF